jgi:hypothetical protein
MVLGESNANKTIKQSIVKQKLLTAKEFEAMFIKSFLEQIPNNFTQ